MVVNHDIITRGFKFERKTFFIMVELLPPKDFHIITALIFCLLDFPLGHATVVLCYCSVVTVVHFNVGQVGISITV